MFNFFKKDFKTQCKEGSIGELARTVADQFIHFATEEMVNGTKFKSNKQFDTAIKKISKNIIDLRLANSTQNLKLMKKDLTKISGILGLCLAILKVEAELGTLHATEINTVIVVLYEELQNKGVQLRAIHGAAKLEEIENGGEIAANEMVKSLIFFVKEPPGSDFSFY